MNHTYPAGKPIQSSRFLSNRRWFGFLLLLLCAGSLWFLLPDPALPPSATILPPDYSVPAPPLPLPDRWIPMTWGWLWRVRYALLGKPVIVDIETRIVRFGGPGEPLLAEALDGHDLITASNGVRAWILPQEELNAFARHIGQGHIRINRMTIGQGTLANMSMTTTVPIQGAQVPVGDFLSYAIQKHGSSIEITGSFVSSELVTNSSARTAAQMQTISLHTNLTLAARMLFPPGKGAFLLDTNRANIHTHAAGLFISPKVQ